MSDNRTSLFSVLGCHHKDCRHEGDQAIQTEWGTSWVCQEHADLYQGKQGMSQDLKRCPVCNAITDKERWIQLAVNKLKFFEDNADGIRPCCYEDAVRELETEQLDDYYDPRWFGVDGPVPKEKQTPTAEESRAELQVLIKRYREKR